MGNDFMARSAHLQKKLFASSLVKRFCETPRLTLVEPVWYSIELECEVPVKCHLFRRFRWTGMIVQVVARDVCLKR